MNKIDREWEEEFDELGVPDPDGEEIQDGQGGYEPFMVRLVGELTKAEEWVIKNFIDQAITQARLQERKEMGEEIYKMVDKIMSSGDSAYFEKGSNSDSACAYNEALWDVKKGIRKILPQIKDKSKT